MIKLLLTDSYSKKDKQLVNIIIADIIDYKLILNILQLTNADLTIA